MFLKASMQEKVSMAALRRLSADIFLFFAAALQRTTCELATPARFYVPFWAASQSANGGAQIEDNKPHVAQLSKAVEAF